MAERDISPPEADLPISADQLAYIVLKARAYDMETAEVDPDESSNSADDGFIDALESSRDNPTGRELRAAIASLDVDAQAALVALTWIGRDDYDADEWSEALTSARERRDGPTWRYLMGLPLLGDYVEEGAAKLGVDLAVEETAGMHHPEIEGDRAIEDRE